MLKRINRSMTLRITSAYRTNPTQAVLLLGKIPPIDLLVEERNLIYKNGKDFRAEARRIIMEKWQTRWAEYNGCT